MKDRKLLVTEVRNILNYALGCLDATLIGIDKDLEIGLAKAKILEAKEKLDEIERCQI